MDGGGGGRSQRDPPQEGQTSGLENMGLTSSWT